MKSAIVAQYPTMAEFNLVEFTTWLDKEMPARGIADRAELVRRANKQGFELSESVLSNIYAGRRKVGGKVAIGIAAGLGIEAEEVLRRAGLSSQKPQKEVSEFERRVLDTIRGNLKTEDQQEGYLDITKSYIKGTRGANRGPASETNEN